MKKGFIATAVTALAIGACTLPVHAATSTDVQIGVSKTAIPTTVVNVTVPMKVAVAVDASATTGNPSVLLGKVLATGKATDDASAGALLFTNYGAEAKITAAKVQNGATSEWTLKNAPTAVHEMSFKVNDSASAYDISKGMSGDILDKEVTLAAGTVTNGKDTVAPLDVKVGGAAADYTKDEDSAQAFRVAWTIALK